CARNTVKAVDLLQLRASCGEKTLYQRIPACPNPCPPRKKRYSANSSVYASLDIVPGYSLEFKTGMDGGRMLSAIRSQGRALGVDGRAAAVKGRFRSLCAVEGADLAPRTLVQGTVERQDPDRARVEAAVRAGADYLVNALDSAGEFRYIFDPLDNYVPKDYSWTRHYGAAYSLSLVGRLLHEPRYLDAAARAVEAGMRRLKKASVGGQCLFEGDRCYFGASALMSLAVSEHRVATGDRRFETAGADLAAFIRAMQRRDGLFFHYWYPKGGLDRGSMLLFASQQGVLALARHARATGDRGALSAAERGMDHLAGPYWDFFLGNWFFVAEHWSCLAAEEMYSQVPKPAYLEFCREIGTHFARTILKKDATAFPENAGGMVVTHALSPHGCGTATAAEAMTSAAALGGAAGPGVAEIREAALWSYSFLLKTQVNAHDGFWMQRPALAVGGFFEKQIVPRIRIDYVQHAISALVRGLDLYPPAAPGAAAEAGRDFVVAVPP
ncbi:MAG: hypothetical protein HY897_13745, partial [Deltaproteobacteria bacterium]|nr:hypothetical protein [Deltaproteobacteria bacterium]